MDYEKVVTFLVILVIIIVFWSFIFTGLKALARYLFKLD